MLRRTLWALPVLALTGCGLSQRVVLQPPPRVSMRRRAGPITLTERVRQEGWMTRFWGQLTPGQRRRVLGRLQQSDPPHASSEEEAAPVWDALGLPDRNALLFGSGLPPREG
jgi:ferric-dicitrate binding protein FerR (iron transport regulator)